MLLLDQDTKVGELMFVRMDEAIRQHSACLAFVPRMVDKNGLLSPFLFSSGRGRRIRIANEKLSLMTHRFINSGLLIKRSAFEEAEGYDERIPLDFSDISFGSRLSKVTDHFTVLNMSLQHAFSDNEKVAVEDAISRFQHFCTGTILTGKSSGIAFKSYFNVLLRAVRLCIRYRDYRFLMKGIEQTLHG